MTTSRFADEIEVTAADHRVVAAEIRAAVDAAVVACDREHGVVHIRGMRPHLPAWADGPQIGARMNGLVRSGVLVWDGGFTLSGNARQRNAMRPCKIYRLIGDLGVAS